MKRFILLFVFFLSITSTYAQIDRHFFGGVELGVTTQREATAQINGLGINCRSGVSGNFGSIMIYRDIEMEGATFSNCTLNFFRGRFWSIVFENIKSDPNALAQRLEDKFASYSISDDEYEYRSRGVELKFDGKRLRYLSISVNNSIANSLIH